MARLVVALALAGALAAAVFGAAAGLTVHGGAIQAGEDASLYCDADGVTVAGWGLETDTSLVSSVRIGDISSSCNGNALFVKVLDGSNNELARGSVDSISGLQHTVNFNTAVSAASIEKLKVWIEGPNGL